MSMIHKGSGKEVLYNPHLVRHTRILPRFYFVAGGIEVSFPISHTPTQNESVCYKIDRTTDRIYVTCGEREMHYGMQFSVEYSLGTGEHFLTQRVRMHNPGTNAIPGCRGQMLLFLACLILNIIFRKEKYWYMLLH